MIVYSSTKRGFCDDVLTNDIDTIINNKMREVLGWGVNKSQLTAFRNSLQYMSLVVNDGLIPDDAGIAIEYTVPQTSKRIDFIISGINDKQQDTAVLVELKQWSTASMTEKDGLVNTFVGGGYRDEAHPSYQVWTYACLLNDFNATVNEENIKLVPCAYLHNYDSDDVITNTFYRKYLDNAPAFLKGDAVKLREFIRSHVKYGDKNQIMYRIDNGKIRPSKNLADQLSSMLTGNNEFLMIDDQKVVYETALQLTEKAQDGVKQVMIVQGGPGTGKSVLAINLLVEINRRKLFAKYVTRNSAPRQVYKAKLTGSLSKSRIDNLFVSSGSMHNIPADECDALIIDEAHRLTEKSGMYGNEGINQVMEIIKASKFSIFFIDEDQRVTLKDIGSLAEIRGWAKEQDAEITELSLSSQFRCNGSDGYLAWLDNTLQIKPTANKTLEGIEYDFQVTDNPTQLHRIIEEKNRVNNKSRVVAGYCWRWISKKKPELKDIVIGDYEATWNLDKDGQAWIIQPNSVSEVGCIHTCQGLELDYVGVIIGPDLVVRNGQVITDATKRAPSDSSVRGYRKMLNNNPETAKVIADSIIKNTYRTLMTRGQKGCYVYCTDPETAEYFRRSINK